jgi:hypothetical protein
MLGWEVEDDVPRFRGGGKEGVDFGDKKGGEKSGVSEGVGVCLGCQGL